MCVSVHDVSAVLRSRSEGVYRANLQLDSNLFLSVHDVSAVLRSPSEGVYRASLQLYSYLFLSVPNAVFWAQIVLDLSRNTILNTSVKFLVNVFRASFIHEEWRSFTVRACHLQSVRHVWDRQERKYGCYGLF